MNELLALLTAHGIDPGKPLGGTPEITAVDVAAMMVDCAPDEEAFLRAKYCGDLRALHETWAYWFVEVMSQGWTTQRRGTIEALSRATLDEHMHGLLCRDCGGVGQVIIDTMVVCNACHGVGRRHWSDREMARRIGLTRLKPTWVERLEWCRTRLRAWEYRACAHLRPL